MTDDTGTVERHPTDEPDGTPAFEASLRPPGRSVSGAEEPDAAEESSVDPGAGYDVSAVSGDTDAYRPE